jgi:hypothetical protein
VRGIRVSTAGHRAGQAVSVGAIAIGMICAIIVGLAENSVTQAVVTNTALVNVAVLVALVVLIGLMIAVLSSLERLRARSGLTIEYYPGETASELVELHRQAAKVIRRARPEAAIYAVNSYLEVFGGAMDGGVEHAQRGYLKEFERKFDSISYHRLIQLSNGERAGTRRGPLARVVSPAYLDHFRAMIRCADEDRRRLVKIEEVEALLPTSFVVVKNGDGGDVIWQMNQHAPQDGRPNAMRIAGVFIVSDPDGRLLRHFMDWFHTLDSGRSHVLTEDELRGGAVPVGAAQPRR